MLNRRIPIATPVSHPDAFVGTAMPDHGAHAVNERRVVGSVTARRAVAQRIG
jgi:hypothetical protein